MYSAIIILLVSSALVIVVKGLRKQSFPQVIAGLLTAVITLIFFWFLDFWGEMLWFESSGYEQRFWKIVITKAGLTLAGALIGLIVVHFLTWTVGKNKIFFRISSKILGLLIGGSWGFSHWNIFLLYRERIMTNIPDPIFNKNTGFYLFTLPFYNALYTFFLMLSVISLITVVLSFFIRFKKNDISFTLEGRYSKNPVNRYGSLYISGAVCIFVLAWGMYLEHYHLIYSTSGVVTGAGWTDVHVRLPAYYIIIVLLVVIGLVLIIPPLRSRFQNFFNRKRNLSEFSHFLTLGGGGTVILAFWFCLLNLVPKLVQWLHVEPNEITLEKPYIAHNIQFSRHGFNLHAVEEKVFPASDDSLTREDVEKNHGLFSNIRLWDWRALDAVYQQFQEIRLYYEFIDVDIDRYTINNSYREVMVSAREMKFSNLPQQSQTFVNKCFKYTHGYGITLTRVNEFTPEGLPHLLIKDIPPQSTYPELDVTQPQIYYGELTDSHVIVNTKEMEFDYPQAEENMYINYPGKGGVKLTTLWRKFLYGWKFDGTRLFLSGYPTSESRIMFHRQIHERVKTIAPFLHFDNDPYIVLLQGKLYWIIDGYSTSRYYPYSEPFSSQELIEYRESERDRILSTHVSSYLDGINYIRNSVKAVVDAFNGSVDFYIFDEDDPIIHVWDKVFPDLFKKKEEMPEGLIAHVRYPPDMLLVQGLVYAKYHMDNPTVFYNQEDLWVRATEKYYDQVQPVEPYYIMWEPPGSDELEFVLILPFTPKNRQVLIGWIAGLSDGDNYGRFIAYKFPKEKRIVGPQQVETKIDQDPYLSEQLTLWNQKGSQVIRGNVLAIPIDKTLFYVEPIYLQAETAAYPELRLVVVMHNDMLSYAETFDKALQGLFISDKREIPFGEQRITEEMSLSNLVQKANEAFENYLKFQGEKRFSDAAQSLETLQSVLKRLSEQTQESTEE
jgi:uncharacterized membrane protein (UPF0182 family)